MKKANSSARRSTAKGNPAPNPSPKTVDDYLAGVPEPARCTLQRVRVAIRSVVPEEATEAISYGIPAFKYKRDAGLVRRIFGPLQFLPDWGGNRSV
jgi:uncharacterized protein YdhG (YjbR/CyaY superfamily)